MSNQSTCFIEFSGSREILIKIGRSIVDKNLNPDFVDKNRKSNVLFEEGLEEEIELDMILEGNILSIFFFGTFRGEYYWFKKVCEFYGLCGKYSDSENVYDFYHKIIYKNGVLIKEIWDKFFCKESIEVLGIDFFIDEWNDPTTIDTLETVNLVDNDQIKQQEEKVFPWQINYIQTSSNKRLLIKL